MTLLILAEREGFLSFPLQVTLMQKAYVHFLSGSGEHAADSQSSSSIYFSSSTHAKGLQIFIILSCEGASKEKSHIILKETFFT